MTYQIIEEVLMYAPADFEAWKNGDKEKILNGHWAPKDVYHQPSYHFGEYFVLKHYADLGWKGHTYFSFRVQPYEKEKEGHAKIIEIFPAESLAVFREAHRRLNHGDERGEPDVFLYKNDGQTMFIEVKKDSDRIKDFQLETLAQIKAILGSEVGIARVVKEGLHYQPKIFELDLEPYEGKRLK